MHVMQYQLSGEGYIALTVGKDLKDKNSKQDWWQVVLNEMEWARRSSLRPPELHLHAPAGAENWPCCAPSRPSQSAPIHHAQPAKSSIVARIIADETRRTIIWGPEVLSRPILACELFQDGLVKSGSGRMSQDPCPVASTRVNAMARIGPNRPTLV
jgi:hypothetical protein